MAKKEIMTTIGRKFHKVGFTLKKHSPEILAVAGTVGVVGSAVMACKATTKLSAIMEESKANVKMIHDYVEEKGFSEKYTEQDSKKDLTIIYAQTGVKLVKLYAPAVILGTLSLTSILASNNILRKRNVALAAAYTTVDKTFKEYRGRVIERFGKELDRELRYNIKAKEVEETVVNEDGTTSTVKNVIQVSDNPNHNSDYARFYDDGCNGWTKDPETNMCFLKMQMAHATDVLKTRGYLFLNEVYDMLGIPRSKAGQVVGWIYDETDPTRDNYVDFGIYDTHKQGARDFINGYERTILLDFNVDGNIYKEMQ